MRIKSKILLSVAAGILLLILSISIVQICRIYGSYAEEDRQHQELLTYKPLMQTSSAPPVAESQSISPPVESNNEVVNQSIIDLIGRYPDSVGWLSVDGTKIDYPFVQTNNNQTYLYYDMDMNHLISGTVFMDYRNAADFTDFTTILYGHQMENDSMFGTMDWFRDGDFFLDNGTGRIFLPYKTLELEIVAALVVSSDDEKIYELDADTNDEKQNFITYIYENAEQFRNGVKLTPQDRFVLLSTCVYDFDGARMVLVARIKNA